jgi:hypothetical protein
MRRQLFLVLAASLLAGAEAAAADLSTIDRTIKKEPAYQAKPKYCLLVFGPEAKARLWLVLDGDVLYVDRNGNGDLTEEGKRVKVPAFEPSKHPAHAQERSIEAGTIAVGGLTHTNLVVSQTQYRRKIDPSVKDPDSWQEYLDSIWRQNPDGIDWMVSLNLDPKCYGLFNGAQGKHVSHFAWVDGRGGHLAFAGRPQDAPVLHFGGPLTLRCSPSEKLQRGEPGELTLCLGTEGLGRGAFVTMCYDLVPAGVRPELEVRFPPKAPGQQAVIRKYVLTQRC